MFVTLDAPVVGAGFDTVDYTTGERQTNTPAPRVNTTYTWRTEDTTTFDNAQTAIRVLTAVSSSLNVVSVLTIGDGGTWNTIRFNGDGAATTSPVFIYSNTSPQAVANRMIETAVTSITTYVTGCGTTTATAFYHRPIPAKEAIRSMMRSRSSLPRIITTKTLAQARDVREERAREMLRRIVGGEKYKQFLKRGFVSVTAKSGLIYQIYPGESFTHVYEKQGKALDRLCVVLKGDYTPTDVLIVRYLMILNDEEGFKKIAYKHRPVERQHATNYHQPIQPESLVSTFKRLKENEGKPVGDHLVAYR